MNMDDNKRRSGGLIRQEHDRGLPVQGYRPQNQRNVDLVKMRKSIWRNVASAVVFCCGRGLTELSKRWHAIGRLGWTGGFHGNQASCQAERVSCLSNCRIIRWLI